MRITTGVHDFRLPGIDDSRVWRGVSRACKLEEKSYSKIANITWASAKTPMLLFTTHVEKGVWARAYLRGWQRGRSAVQAGIPRDRPCRRLHDA